MLMMVSLQTEQILCHYFLTVKLQNVPFTIVQTYHVRLQDGLLN